MKSFFLGYGDETPGSVEPSGEHDSCFVGRFIGMFSTRKLAIIVGNPLSTYFFLTRPLPSGKFILFI